MATQAFAGKSVLVTGGAGGIGRATALAFSQAGARVAVSDRTVAGGEQTVAMIRQAGGEAVFILADVTKADQVEAMVAKVVESFGWLDCAFNNAGIEEESKRLADCDEVLFDRIIDVNVKGAFLCMKYEIRQMLKQGAGAIVNTASVAGLIGAPLQPAYAASKHAVVGMTKTAGAEYGRAGIRINSVCPGVIRTEMMDRALERAPKREKLLQSVHPIGRIGEADEIANAVLWLCSDAASFVVGHQLTVDGGMTII